MEEAKHFIGNRWVAPAVGETIPVIDPSDGQMFAQLARGNAADIDRAVKSARAAYDGPWGHTSAADRGRILARLSMLIGACHDEIAQLEARDTGKPLKQAHADAAGIARYFEFYAGAADKLHGETLPYQTGYTVLTIREPHGVTGHIVPWNYPLQIFGRSVARGARGRQRVRGEACRGRVHVDPAHRRTRGGSGPARRHAEHRHGLRLRGGRGARAASGHRPHFVHRLARYRRGGRHRWPPTTTSP